MYRKINSLINKINERKILFLINCLIFLISVVFGFIINLNNFSSDTISTSIINEISSALSVEKSVFSILIKGIFELFLLYILLSLFSLNRFTFYLTYLIVIYRGILLGITFKLYFFIFGISGIIIFILLEFIKNIIISFSIILLITLSSNENMLTCKNVNYNFLENVILCFLISVLGVICEFLLLICVLRPFNLYLIV